MIALIILFIISLFLESLVPNMIREFIPFFMISSIIIASTCVKDIKDGFILVFIFGVFYDLFYTDLLFFHGFMFMLLFFLSSIIIDNKKNFFLMIFTYYLLIILYNIVMYLFTFLQSNINIISLINIVIKSLLINSLYFIFIYLLFVGIKCLISNRKKKGTY